MSFSEKQIDLLRQRVQSVLSDWRFTHTAEVEKMAVRIGELYVPDKIPMLRAAALLHDITKEKSTEEQWDFLLAHKMEISELDRISPKTLHAKTAVLEIEDNYAEFATPELLSAVRRHTTGHPDMSLCDAVIYLADYIDMSRKFDDCVKLRELFWSKKPEEMQEEQRLEHLWQTLLVSFDMTLEGLLAEGNAISLDTVATRNAIIYKLKK